MSEYQRQSGKGFRSAFKENSNPSQQYLLSLSCFALFLLDFMFALLGLNTSDQPTHFQFTSKLNYVYNMYLQLVKQRLPVILYGSMSTICLQAMHLLLCLSLGDNYSVVISSSLKVRRDGKLCKVFLPVRMRTLLYLLEHRSRLRTLFIPFL